MESRLAWMTIPLVALALAGCVAGNDAQLPTVGGHKAAAGQQPGGQGASGNGTGNGTGNQSASEWNPLVLSVDPTNGTAPLNVTLRYDVTNKSANLTWGLTLERTGDVPASGNGTGNATGNATGNSTTSSSTGQGNSTTGQGNSTSNSTSASGTTTGAAGNGTTGNGTAGNGTTGNGTTSSSSGTGSNSTTGTSTAPAAAGNGTSGNSTATSGGNFTLAINGTAADLPGVTVQRLNVSGTYTVRFHVDFGNGTQRDRNATVIVQALQPGAPLGNETLHKTGLIVLGGTEADCNAVGGVDIPWVLNATRNGTAAEIRHIHAALKGSTTAVDLDLSLVMPNRTAVANSTFGSKEVIDVDGPLEAGNYTLHIAACAAAAGTWTLDAVADYVVAGAPNGVRAKA
jgi:hypothetical protein